MNLPLQKKHEKTFNKGLQNKRTLNLNVKSPTTQKTCISNVTTGQ